MDLIKDALNLTVQMSVEHVLKYRGEIERGRCYECRRGRMQASGCHLLFQKAFCIRVFVRLIQRRVGLTPQA